VVRCLLHRILVKVIVDKRAFVWFADKDIRFTRGLSVEEKFDGLLTLHLQSLEGANLEVGLKLLIVDQLTEDIFDVMHSGVVNLGHVLKDGVHNPCIICLKSIVNRHFVRTVNVVKGF
jgi:hypothetical protein